MAIRRGRAFKRHSEEKSIVIQDEELPWLTERRNIGPVSFSNRMLIEGPAEALQIAGEVALTGGAATAARGVTRAGLGAAAGEKPAGQF